VTIAYSETGSGVTNEVMVPVSVITTFPGGEVNMWNDGGDTVHWGDAGNWSRDRVPGAYAADRGLIANGTYNVTVATNFTGAHAYEVLVRDDSILNIEADLKNIDDLNVAPHTGAQDGTVNQTAGDVTAVLLKIADAGNTESPTYNLSGGSLSLSSTATIWTNGSLNVSGGSFVAGGVTTVEDGAILLLTGGSVTMATGVVHNGYGMGIKSDAVIEISGGTYTDTSRMSLHSGATFRIVGDDATVTLHQVSSSVAGTFDFVLDETGVSTLGNDDWGQLSSCHFEVNGSNYIGGAQSVVLYSGTYHSGNTVLGSYNVTGLGIEGLDWEIVDDLGSEIPEVPHTVTLNILERQPIGIFSDGMDSAGDLVFSWNTHNGLTYSVLTNANLVYPNWGILDTILGDGGTVSVTNTPDQDQLFYKVIAE
jgi:hypothetical protein